jgi:hypothetical protein
LEPPQPAATLASRTTAPSSKVSFSRMGARLTREPEPTAAQLTGSQSAGRGRTPAAPDRLRYAGPRIPRRPFQVLHLRLPALLRGAGITPRRSVSCFCRSRSVVPWLGGDFVAEFI